MGRNVLSTCCLCHPTDCRGVSQGTHQWWIQPRGHKLPLKLQDSHTEFTALIIPSAVIAAVIWICHPDPAGRAGAELVPGAGLKERREGCRIQGSGAWGCKMEQFWGCWRGNQSGSIFCCPASAGRGFTHLLPPSLPVYQGLFCFSDFSHSTRLEAC